LIKIVFYLEQLDAIDSGMDRINAEMRDAEKNLEGLEKCCGLCVLPWKRYKTSVISIFIFLLINYSERKMSKKVLHIVKRLKATKTAK
jgi:hypothetical protein